MRKRIIIALFVLIFVSMMPIKSMSHGVPADSIEGKHKTTSVCILQEAIYATELLSGLVGAYLGSMTGLGIAGVPMSETSRFLIYYPMTAIGAATGTSFVGICLNQKASFPGALIGSALGVAAVVLCKDILPPLSFCPCASIGAVLGYNYKTFFGK